MIMGQDKILSRIDSLNLDTFPHSVILEGLEGSGKHSICDYIRTKFNFELIDLMQLLSENKNNFNLQDIITFINSRSEIFMYVIDVESAYHTLSIKDQNILLKLIEEPLTNAFLILLCQNKHQFIDTIINRCQVWSLAPYSKDLLSKFLSSDNLTHQDIILSVAKTPGQVAELLCCDIMNIYNLAEKIFDKANVVSIPNLLSIINKFAFKREKDKINLNIFINMLLYVCKNKIINNENIKNLYTLYNLTRTLRFDYFAKNINKEHLFEKYLVDIWSEVRK